MAATYKAQILARWDWDAVVWSARIEALEHIASGGTSICGEGCDGDGHEGSAYLGSVMSIYPSGKYYMPWTTNQTADDVERDSRFGEALEAVASKFGGYIASGEGDPTDLYFMRYFTNDELSR